MTRQYTAEDMAAMANLLIQHSQQQDTPPEPPKPQLSGTARNIARAAGWTDEQYIEKYNAIHAEHEQRNNETMNQLYQSAAQFMGMSDEEFAQKLNEIKRGK